MLVFHEVLLALRRLLEPPSSDGHVMPVEASGAQPAIESYVDDLTVAFK